MSAHAISAVRLPDGTGLDLLRRLEESAHCSVTQIKSEFQQSSTLVKLECWY